MLVDVQNDGFGLNVDIGPRGQTALCEVQSDRLVSERQNNFILAQPRSTYCIVYYVMTSYSVHDQEIKGSKIL